ncbi:hypothetical protein Poli38472_013042 [Pythium oligandrum]|uniref:Uncharacterized protein n=1 Tax=Pythium oligandrum TaxID=41045 RepID=A0A8K1CJJ3_PYTOL|nr:hypothetical protein Poli38472_013042 [Pythium oligandrum]|eukprot:TMW64420.1 hypothetical protein Poli38472_013042 [Pythium oligandrum]
MTDMQQQVNHLNTKIDAGAQETKSYLDQLKKKVSEYDQEYKLSETASSYLDSGMQTAQSSVDELKKIGLQLQDKSKDASDETVRSAQRALGKTKESLAGLQTKAREYDNKFRAKGSSLTSTVEEVVNAARQKTMDAIEMANEQATHVLGMIQNMAGQAAGNAKYGAQVVAGGTANAADTVDEKLGVTPKATGVIDTVKETVVNLDKRIGVSETAAKIDATVTGGLGAKAMSKTGELVSNSVEYVAESLQKAKIVSSDSSTAQSVDKKASHAADKAVDAKDQVKDKAGQAQNKAQDVGTSAKQTGNSLTEDAKQKAGYAADKIAEKGTQAKEGAQNMMGKAHEKGVHGMEYAKDNASYAAGTAQQKGSQFAHDAKQTGHHAMGTAQQKGHEANVMGHQQAHQARVGTQQMTGQTPNQNKTTMETLRDGAQNVGTATKETLFGTSSGHSSTDPRNNQYQNYPHA